MKYVIGADEVGRGCLAGPLCVGAVLVPEDMHPIAGVRDSKKLSARQRSKAAEALTGITRSLVFIGARDIDRKGISPCLVSAFQQAVETLLKEGLPVSRVLIDGNPMPLTFGSVPVEFIVKGDDLDWRIGAASILAKVTRDAFMDTMALSHPVYGFDSNKGYGSQKHQDAIRDHGLTSLHRTTFCRRFVRPTLPDDDSADVLDLFL